MTETQEFVYLCSGQKCRVLSHIDSQVFVTTRITHGATWGDEYEEYEKDGEILCVSKDDIFDSPPTQVLVNEIGELNAKIIELKVERRELENTVTREREQYEQAMAEYAEFSPALARLDEFIKRKNITHYFVHEKWGAPEILSVTEDTMSDREYSHPPEERLLTLTPTGKHTLTWKLNQYHDGSGSDYECTPCASHREALDLAQGWVEQQIADGEYTRRILQYARKHHLVLPDDYVATMIERERQQLTKSELGEETKRTTKRREKEQEWETLRQ